MRIPQKSESLQRYNSAKTVLSNAAQKSNNQAFFKQEGDRIELTQDVRIPLDGQQVVVKKGSAFDNDVKTRDKISLETAVDSTVQADTFEHFSERKGLLFKRDQEMLTVTYSDRAGFNFSNSTLTFEI